MIHPNANDTLTVRSVFVIGPDKKIKLIITYPASTGRNFDEVLRVIDSLQLTAKHQVATPVNWKRGEDVIIVPLGLRRGREEEVPAGWKPEKPYLRDREAARVAPLLPPPPPLADLTPSASVAERSVLRRAARIS